tara:strand:- start:163 stop:639 length:477 start_codon:yes stop_codon:yes gene_type:complete
MRFNIETTKIRFPKKDFLLVISQFIIIALHFIKINLFNQKIIQGEFLIINYISNFLIILALIFIIFSVKSLGKSLSAMPRPKENSKLITIGIYSIIRHPMYYSLIIISFSLFIKSFTIYNFILSILLTFIISNKIKIEEEYLTQRFNKYTLYKKEVKI